MFRRRFRSARRALAAAASFAVAVSVAPSFVSAQPLAVDGDLADFTAATRFVASDRASDVSSRMRSGFDFTRVLVHFYPKTDTLYLGLDLLDSDDGAGVAGDADGDSNPNGLSRGDVRQDEFGVGRNEYYVFEIDANDNGRFDEYFDLRVKYKDNRLVIERGDSHHRAVPEVRGLVAIGTRGAASDPHLPNQNRATEDIEIAIDGYARFDEVPRSFRVRAHAGSLVDSSRDDESDDPVEYAFGEVLEFRLFFPDPDQRRMSDCAVAMPGDVVTVAGTVTNNGSFTLRPSWLIFHFPNGLRYVEGSVANAEKGRTFPAEDGTVVRFVRPGGDAMLEPGESATVTFNVAADFFPTCHLTIRAYAEGVLSSDGITCIFSSLEALCIVE